jgi:uncharacterized repeat protein (TIGR03837 family)
MLWDIFCRVIDNHGDAGVTWRLARELAERGDAVRLWIDDARPLAWMAPGGHPRVQVSSWFDGMALPEPGDVVVEAFGCDPPPAWVDRMAVRDSVWINLEYLSAEAYVERSHGLMSPVRAGLAKYFFYPGFSAATGGLLREQDLQARQQAFDADAWLGRLGIARSGARRVSLFCYEPAALPELLAQLAAGPQPTDLLVTAGRATHAARAALPAAPGALRVHWLPLLSQEDFDHLLWASDFNFVRGEDSLVRALWAGKPFAWQLYPQEDDAHHAKLHAFLRWLQPPDELARLYRVWNGELAAALPGIDVDGWQPAARAARQRALALPELATALRRFVCDRGRI